MKLKTLCADREQAASALAKRLCEILEQAIKARGKASIVVSGGTSPVGLFGCLSQHPLDWSKVTVVPSDERLVPLTSSERNETMVRKTLLIGNASSASLVSLVSDPDDPDACETYANANVEALGGTFDAVVLGMGEDGHTASLFPDAPKLSHALASSQSCIIQDVPSQGRTRISLTPSALLNAEHLFLLAFGAGKLAVLESAELAGPVEQYPVRVVLLQDRVPMTTYWAP